MALRSMRWAQASAGLALTAFLSGCAGEIVRMAPPDTAWREAVVPGGGAADRMWADAPPANGDAQMSAFTEQTLRRFAEAEERGEEPSFDILALSGGAEDGAYGAGVIVGWTETGERPRFDIVTGVSTGAIIAPFAFLGPDYDDELETFFTTTSTDDLVEPALFSALLGGLGLVDATPFETIIAETVTLEFLEAIAQEHEAGRRLFMATTNLDARRPVIWDMGAIAVRAVNGDEAAVDLFRAVMRASASIPGAFPPVFIDVQIGDEIFQEMHVDGGVVVAVFVAPSWFVFADELAAALNGRATIYVILNNKVTPPYEVISDDIFSIAGASISEMIRAQGRGDLLRIFATARINGFAYRVTVVPSGFDVVSSELFDPVYMTALFEVGREFGRSGEPWSSEPPALPASVRDRLRAESAQQ